MTLTTDQVSTGQPRNFVVHWGVSIAEAEEGLRKMAEALNRIADIRRRLPAKQWLRAVAASERADALAWLNDHLDATYADLGLVRDPHIVRGVE